MKIWPGALLGIAFAMVVLGFAAWIILTLFQSRM